MENGERLIAVKQFNYKRGLDENKRYIDRKIGRTKKCSPLHAGGSSLPLDCISTAESTGGLVCSFSLSRVCVWEVGAGMRKEMGGLVWSMRTNGSLRYLRNGEGESQKSIPENERRGALLTKKRTRVPLAVLMSFTDPKAEQIPTELG